MRNLGYLQKSLLSSFLTVVIPLTSSLASPQGTSNGGGGNLYRGRPIESYIINPSSLPAYQKSIKYILDNANPDVASPMLYVLNKKTWYFVPGPLNKLSAEQIGAKVPSDQLQQFALQDFNSVWVDQDQFDSLSLDDQEVALMHEILMGFKLLKFDSPLSTCLARHMWGVSRWGEDPQCPLLSSKPIGKPSQLSNADYDDVRKTTFEYIYNFPPRKAEAKGYDWYLPLIEGNFSYGGRKFERTIERETTKEKNFKDVKGDLAIGYVPTYGYSIEALDRQGFKRSKMQDIPKGTLWPSTSTCKVQVGLSNDTLNLEIQVGDYKIVNAQSTSPTDHWPSQWYQTARPFWYTGEMMWEAPLLVDSPIPIPPGDHTERLPEVDVTAYFDVGHQLKMVVIKEGYSAVGYEGMHWDSWYDDVLRGDYYICSTEREMKFNSH